MLYIISHHSEITFSDISDVSASAPKSTSSLHLILLLHIVAAHIDRIVSRVASGLMGMCALGTLRQDTIPSLFFVFILDVGLVFEALFIFVAEVSIFVKTSTIFLG